MPELVVENELEKLKKFNRDVEWFQNNYENLKKDYKGEYVAINNQKVIGHDKDLNILIKKLKEQNEDISSFVIEQIHEHKYIYAM